MTNVDYLFKLRLVVARVGEMDLAQWWNTNGQLGTLGAAVLRRGFPRTYRFAQARSVFAVASRRCRDLYHSDGLVSLWELPALVEDDFEERWQEWIDDSAGWERTFQAIEQCSASLEQELLRLDLVSPLHVAEVGKLRRAAEGRVVLLPGQFTGSNDDLAMLALAFSRGEVGLPAVPCQRWSANE